MGEAPLPSSVCACVCVSVSVSVLVVVLAVAVPFLDAARMDCLCVGVRVDVDEIVVDGRWKGGLLASCSRSVHIHTHIHNTHRERDIPHASHAAPKYERG